MNAVGAWFVSLTSIPLVLDVLQRWYYARDIDYEEGSCWPSSWLCWGTCYSWGRRNPGYDKRYLILRLPLYDWLPDLTRDESRLQPVQWAIFMFAGKWHFRQIGIWP